jgi:hypothetical protein
MRTTRKNHAFPSPLGVSTIQHDARISSTHYRSISADNQRAACAHPGLEGEQATLRSRLEGERQLRILTAHIAAAAQAASVIGAAIERFAEAMRAPLPLLPRGRAGGLARTRTAWRYLDGTFMPESEKEAAYLEDYERYAAGGRARALHARRNVDGTFAR